MGHDDKTWWHSYTYRGMRDGQFLLAPNRDPSLGIDPNMKTIAGYKDAKAELDKLRRQNAVEADARLAALEKQVKTLKAKLEQKEIDLQAATARASNVDAAVKAEVAKVETALTVAHKAALTELKTTCDEAREGELLSLELRAAGELATMKSERDVAITELEAMKRLVAERDDEIKKLVEAAAKCEERIKALEAERVALNDKLKAMTEAKTKAEEDAKESRRKAESNRVDLNMARDELKTTSEAHMKLQGKHNELKREFLLLGRGNLSSGVRIGLLEGEIEYYQNTFGPIPDDVYKRLLAGLPVASANGTIVTPPAPETKVEVVAEDPKNGTEVATATEAPPEDPADVDDTDGDNPFADDDDPIDDVVIGETQAIGSGSVEFVHDTGLVPPSDPPSCDSPTDCEKIATWRTQHPFARNDGEAPLDVLTCDEHHEHCEVFIDALQAFVESPPADADELRALLVPINPAPINPTTNVSNPVEAP